MMTVYEKLLQMQEQLKAPKNQYNKFGKYYYRNCEDILEALKPLQDKAKVVTFLTDKIIFIEGRHYVEATAKFIDVENGETIEVTAYAREADIKKGMDVAQITGATSSYARKYALNGLFNIDDNKDPDTMKPETKTNSKPENNSKPSVKELQTKIKIAEKTLGLSVDEIKSHRADNLGANPKYADFVDYLALLDKWLKEKAYNDKIRG